MYLQKLFKKIDVIKVLISAIASFSAGGTIFFFHQNGLESPTLGTIALLITLLSYCALFILHLTHATSNSESEPLRKVLLISNSIFIVLMGLWFFREIFNIFRYGSDTIILLFNTAVLSLALFIVSQYLVKPKIPRQKKKTAPLFSLREDYWVIVAIAIMLLEFILIFSWDKPYTYHPGEDEYVIPSVYFSQGDLDSAISNPDTSQNPLYDNQHLMYYILTPIFFIADSVFDLSLYGYFLTARVANFVFSSLVIFFTYLSAKLLFDRKTAVLAAFIFPISRLFLHYSLFIRTDMILTLLVSLVFFLTVKSKTSDNRLNYLALGMILGLATSLKPYALIFTVPILLIIIIDGGLFNLFKKMRKRSKNPLSALNIAHISGHMGIFWSAMLIAFEIGRFYHTFTYSQMGASLFIGLSHANTGHYGIYPSNISLLEKVAFPFTIYANWNGILFSIMLIGALLVILYLTFKQKTPNLLLLSGYLFPFIVFMWSRLVQSGKFNLPIYPFLLISISYTTFIIARKGFLLKIIVPLITIVLILQMSFLTIARINSLTREDPRTALRTWMIENDIKKENTFVAGNKIRWQRPVDFDELVHISSLKTADYIIVFMSEYNKYNYYNHNKELYRKDDWFPGDFPDKALLEYSTYFSDNDGAEIIIIDGREFELIQTFFKPQTFLGIEHNDYTDPPITWENWAVTNPRPIRVYQAI
jgi:hypothetical protein